MNRIQYVNKNNFLRWRDPSIDPEPVRAIIENGYLYDKFRQSMPIYTTGEYYSFYLNFDVNPLTKPEDVNERFKLRLIDSKDEFVSDSLGDVKKLILSTVGAEYPYHLYCKYFTVTGLDFTGTYRLAICDYDAPDTVYYVSNCVMLQEEEVKEFTNYFQFRNDVNFDNFYYELLPVPVLLEAFYQRFRIVVNKIEYQYDEDIKQYRRASDRTLRNYRYDVDKIIKIESHWFSEDDHDAMVVMLQHREVYINTLGVLQKSDYKVTPKTAINISKAECDIVQTGITYSYLLDIEDDPDFNNDFNDDFNNE
jgi:hypothetical protein